MAENILKIPETSTNEVNCLLRSPSRCPRHCCSGRCLLHVQCWRSRIIDSMLLINSRLLHSKKKKQFVCKMYLFHLILVNTTLFDDRLKTYRYLYEILPKIIFGILLSIISRLLTLYYTSTRRLCFTLKI